MSTRQKNQTKRLLFVASNLTIQTLGMNQASYFLNKMTPKNEPLDLNEEHKRCQQI